MLRLLAMASVAVTVLAGSTTALAGSAGHDAGTDAGTRAGDPAQYIVMLKDRKSTMVDAAQTLSARHNGRVGAVWDALRGFTVAMTAADARGMAAESAVDYVMADHVRQGPAATDRTVSLSPQTPVGWGLDRIDQHARPLDNSYAYDDSAGAGVRVYILSTGIAAANPDFGGRAFYGPNFSSSGSDSSDCIGTGTGIAGVVGGTQTGVAKSATMIGVRIFGGTISQCEGVVNAPFSGILAAFNWVIANAVRPAVIVYSVGDGCVDPMTGQAVQCDPNDLVAERNAQTAAYAAGISVVATAGESSADRCALDGGVSPGTFYVGATTVNDARAGFSNYGACLNMWAPGEAVATDGIGGQITSSGTALASGYVAGTVALFLGKPEFAGAGPGAIYTELVTNRSTPNVLTGIGPGSPNLLLFTGPPGFFTTGDSASVAPTGSGLEIVGTNSSGRMQYRTGAAGAWTPWTHSVTQGWRSVGVEPNADGRLALAGVTPSGEVWLRTEATAHSNVWSTWSRLSGVPGAVPVGRVVMAYNLSNRLQMFVTTQQGSAYYRSQLVPGSRQWSAWTALSFSGKLRSIAAVTRGDGRIEILGVDDAGRVWRTVQTTPTDTNWAGFTQVTGMGVTAVAAARNADGTVELVGVDAGGGAWRRRESSAGSWSAWAHLPAKTLSRVAAEAGPDGRITLVGVDNLGNLWQSQQTGINATTYSSWSTMDGQLRP